MIGNLFYQGFSTFLMPRLDVLSNSSPRKKHLRVLGRIIEYKYFNGRGSGRRIMEEDKFRTKTVRIVKAICHPNWERFLSPKISIVRFNLGLSLARCAVLYIISSLYSHFVRFQTEAKKPSSISTHQFFPFLPKAKLV